MRMVPMRPMNHYKLKVHEAVDACQSEAWLVYQWMWQSENRERLTGRRGGTQAL